MNRCRMQIFYSGHVQGVGFRYTAKTVAAGFEVTGAVRNLPDGRVELIAEGAREELEAFRAAICDAGLAGFIRDENVNWGDAQNEFRGFEIVRLNAMKYAIIADIHANLEAFQAVLEDAQSPERHALSSASATSSATTPTPRNASTSSAK